MANAAASIAYDDENPTTTFPEGVTGTWPNPDGAGSYSIEDLSLVSKQATTPTNGDSWSLSTFQDAYGSVAATGIAGTISIHSGGDLGTPGVFTVGPPPTGVGANFDGLGVVDAADLAIWRSNFGTGTTQAQGDADGDNDVDGRDFLVWQRQLGTTPTAAVNAAAVPEPGAIGLAAFGLAAAAFGRRRRA